MEEYPASGSFYFRGHNACNSAAVLRHERRRVIVLLARRRNMPRRCFRGSTLFIAAAEPSLKPFRLYNG